MPNDMLNDLEDTFKANILSLLDTLPDKTGYKWQITSGRRTMREQQRLFDIGRITSGKIVTKAPPGSSAHNFGCAVDIVPIRFDRLWWDAPHELWEDMATVAEGMGLVAGLHFKTFTDPPHIESANWRDLRAEWRRGNLQIA